MKFSESRFWLRVQPSDDPDGCWLWLGKINPTTGYGIVQRDRREEGAHRTAYALTYGEVPDGLSVLHTCDIRPCVRPDHLYAGTQRDNVLDMYERGRVIGYQGSPGMSNGAAMLTDGEVVMMRALHGSGAMNQRQLVVEFGASKGAVSNIVLYKSWRDL
jgi:hypothetical protein